MMSLKAALFWFFSSIGVPGDLLMPCSDVPGGSEQVVLPGEGGDETPRFDGPGRTRANGDEPIYNGF